MLLCVMIHKLVGNPVTAIKALTFQFPLSHPGFFYNTFGQASIKLDIVPEAEPNRAMT